MSHEGEVYTKNLVLSLGPKNTPNVKSVGAPFTHECRIFDPTYTPLLLPVFLKLPINEAPPLNFLGKDVRSR